MKKVVISLFILLFAGCASESLSPQASFSFEDENAVSARRVLHSIAIENNLMFEDHSHKYPSGTSTVLAIAERADGLELMLLGSSGDKRLDIAVHCHDKCINWKGIYSAALEGFGKQWVVTQN